MLDSDRIRRDFPIFKQRVNGKPLVYLDSASTSQKPQKVIDALTEYYSQYNSNIHRAIHTLGERATAAYEQSREKVAAFLGADSQEIVFCRSTTEALNIVARGWAQIHLQDGDEIMVTQMEHHSNLVPWLVLAKQKACKLQVAPITTEGTIDIDAFTRLVTDRTRLVAITHVSNVLGTINPLVDIIGLVKKKNPKVKIVVDGAQSVPHMPVDVAKLDCDFLCFSAHKCLGPTGVGVLFARKQLLEEMEPLNFGSDMIKTVTFDKITYNDLPWKFEAGTQNIADVIAFAAAIDYIKDIGLEAIYHHEQQLTRYALDRLQTIDGLKVYGPVDYQIHAGVISFSIEDIHPHDIATILDRQGIAIRSGHHCAMPLHSVLGVAATARASFYLYTTKNDIDQLVEGLIQVKKILRG